MNKQLFARVRMLLLVAVLAVPLSAQDATVNVTQEGGLWDALEAQNITDFTTVKNLTITGTMGDVDFQLIKNQMSNLESIDLVGVDVKEIPEGTFASKEKLKMARLPEGITSIKGQTFSNCQLLESVTFGSQTAVTGKIVFPASLRNVEYNAFSSCQSLTELDFSACTNLEGIGSSAFSSCQGLTHLDFSACTSLRYIDSYALAYLNNLKEVILPSQGNLSLGYNCFYIYGTWENGQNVYKGLENLTLTKAVTSIGSECLPRSLKTLFIESSTPPSCSENFDYLINNGTSSLKVYVPNGAKRNYAVANGWSKLYQYMQELGFKVNITGYGMVQKGSSYYGNSDIFFPTQGSAITLKAVPDMGNELLSVKLDGNAINVAEDGTFTIPAESTIGTLDVAFTVNPFTIDNPNGGELKDLIAATGRNTNSITVLKVTGKMAAKDWTFVKNSLPMLEEFDISETDLTTVPEEALRNKEKLTTVHLPTSVTTISNNAFNNCNNLTIVDGCGNITEIGSSAFYNCNKLSVFPFGETIQRIGSTAFSSCSSLPTTLVFSGSFTSISDNAFRGSSVRSFDLSQCTFTNSISYNPFGECASLLLPEKGDYNLQWSALNNSKLTELRLPAAVSRLYSNVLPSTLERLFVSRTTPLSADNNSFSNLDLDNCTLYVPIGSTTAYQEATGWSNFTKVKETGFKLNLSGYGMVQLGNITYKNGDVLFTNQGSATTLKAVPDDGNELISVKLNDNAVIVAEDGTFTIPAETTIGTLDVAFTAKPFTIDNPNGGELKDLIAATGKSANSISVLKVTGKMTTKDWTFVKNNLTMLEEFDISETDLASIPEEALRNKDQLRIVHLPTSVTTINNNAFNNCRNLTIVDGCDNVAEIGSSAFSSCNKLFVFPFGDAIQKIENNAFSSCSSLPTTLVFSSSLTYIRDNAFSGSSVRSFDLSQCTFTNYISYNPFGECTSLLLPEKGDYNLQWSALSNTKLTELRLPAAVSGLYGNNVLPTTLERLYVSKTEPMPIDANYSPFNNVDLDNCTLYVPIGSTAAYQEATGWSNFTKVKETGFKVIISGYGLVQQGNVTYGNGDALFANQGSATTLKAVPEDGNNLISVKLNDNAVSVAEDGTFTIPVETTIGTLDVSFTTNPFTIDNPNGGELKDLIAATGRATKSMSVLKVKGKMTTKDWSFVKNSLPALEVFDISETDVTIIPEEALCDRDKLTTVHLPASVTTISNYAFNSCRNLAIIDGCDNVMEIGYYAFGDCNKLSEFPFGDALQKIGNDAFSNCTSLPTTLVFSASFTSISSNVFSGSSVRDFDLSQCSFTNGISSNPFGECTSLLLPEKGDYNLEWNALSNSKLTELRLPAAVSRLYENVFPSTLERLYVSKIMPLEVYKNTFNNLDFDNCTLYVPIGSKDAYQEATGWTLFTKVEESGIKVNITGYGAVLQGYIAYGNGDNFFTDQSNATMLKAVPEDGNELISVKLNDNAVSVDAEGNFTIPAGTAIGTLDVAFTTNPFTIDNPNGGELKSQIVAMGKSVNTITILKVTGKMSTKDWTYVKSSLSMLKELDISQTDVKAIPEQTFQDHQNIAAVRLPSTVITIGNNAFNNCRQLVTVDGCENVKEIGSYAFASCQKLTNFPFANAIQKIEYRAFENCKSLPTVLVLSASLTGVNDNAFSNSSVSSFDLSQCTMTNGISYNPFGKCTSLLLPEKGNYNLQWNALKDAELTDLRLPAAVSYIYGENVLPTTLERLYVSSSTPIEVGSTNAFNNINRDNCTLYVPIGSTDAYAEAPGWVDFTNVKEYGMQVVVGDEGKVRAGTQTLMGTGIFFPSDNTVTFEILPNLGWHTDAVTLDGTNVPFADNKFTLSSSQLSGKLAVTFAVNQFNLQLQIAGTGKVKFGTLEYTANQTLAVDSLATLNFTLEPAEGQMVSSITFNGEESVVQNGGKTYVTPAITANSTLAITFGAAGAEGDIAIYTVKTGEGGSVEYKNTTLLPETTINLPKGQDAVFAMKPDQYYIVDAVKLNGENITNQLDVDGKLTVQNVADAAKLEVTFRINAEIAVTMEDGGTLTNLLSEKQKAMVTKLTIKGQMWDRDFRAMRDEMPLLEEIDLWEAKTEYIPYQAFCTSSNWDGNSVGCKTLTKVRLPETTRNIGGFAFAGCTNLKEVNFTELKNLEYMDSYSFESTSLQVIDLSNTKLTEVNGAFRNVKNLEDIRFPQTMTKLGNVFSQSTLTEIDLSNCTNLKTLDGTFYECKSLVKVILPEGLTSINGNAFSNCETLTTVNFPKSLQSISGWSFNNTKLEKVDLSELTELQSIGSYAFYDNKELTEVLFPSSLEKLENNAFYNCPKLTSVDLSKTQLKIIPNEAFSNCGSLESVKMPKTLETIGRYAFAWNNKLGGVLELASTVTGIGESAFAGTQISVVRSEATVPPTLSNNSMPDAWVAAFVPEGYAETYKATAIWEDKVILDKEVHADVTVSKEGNLAIDINEQAGISPALVTHLKVHGPLGAQDFAIMRENMTVLYDLDMSDAEVSVIPENAFSSVKKKVLMNVILPASLLRIEANAFNGCSGLNGSLTLPTNLKFIGWGAFRGCTSLDEVVLNENLEVIQGYAFEGCSSLTQEITLPRDFQSLGERAFANCSSLYGTVKFNRDFYMFMGTEGYGSSAGSCFQNCSKIETVDMSEPDFLDEIPYGTFAGCTSLKTVLLPPMLDRIDNNAFYNCKSLDNIEFPNKLRVINYSAFQNCTSLSSVNLSDCKDLGTIEGYAFYGCSSLETAYLPKNLNWIREYAFADCRKLANLTVEALQPADLGEYVFRHVHTDRCVLSIPTGTFYDYLSAAQWGEFVSMRKSIDVTVGEGANLFFMNEDSKTNAPARRAAAVGQQGSKVKDGSSLYVQENEKAIFKVNPDENVQIAKVIFNGQDVTDQMVNGTYQTPGVTDASSFEVQVNVVGDIHVKELRMLDDEVAVKQGENRQLRFAVYPTNATNKSIEWTCSDEAVATVNSEGIITGVAPGKAKITAKTVDGGFEEECQIIIMSNNYWLVMDNSVENFVENTIDLPLALHNEGEARDIQFDVYMPEGVDMANRYGNFNIQKSGRASGHNVVAARTSDGAVRVIVYSQSGNQFQGTDGELLTLPFTTGEETGSFDVTIKNIHISGPDNFDFVAPNHTIHFSLKDYPLGDSNGDGKVSINDVTTTVDKIIERMPNRFIQKAADANMDGDITVSDVTATIDIILERPSAPQRTNKAAPVASDDKVFIDDFKLGNGQQQTINLQLTNTGQYTAFQCDIILPEGLKIAEDDEQAPMISISNANAHNHVVQANYVGNDVLRLLVMSMSNTAFSADANNVVSLTLEANAETLGQKVINIENVRLVNVDSRTESLAPNTQATVDIVDGLTGIQPMAAVKGTKIRVEGHDIVVTAESDGVVRLTSTDGKQRMLQVRAGEQRFSVSQSGVYVIEGRKIVIK